MEELTDAEKARLEAVRHQHFLDMAQELAEEAVKEAELDEAN